MAADFPEVPALMSLEGRANMIADVAGQLHGSPAERRKAVQDHALAHLRAAVIASAPSAKPVEAF